MPPRKKHKSTHKKVRGKMKWHAIVAGRKTGVFHTQWEYIEPHVINYSHKKHKSFDTQYEAIEWYNEECSPGKQISHEIVNNNDTKQINKKRPRLDNTYSHKKNKRTKRENNKRRREVAQSGKISQKSKVSVEDAFEVLHKNRNNKPRRKTRKRKHDSGNNPIKT